MADIFFEKYYDYAEIWNISEKKYDYAEINIIYLFRYYCLHDKKARLLKTQNQSLSEFSSPLLQFSSSDSLLSVFLPPELNFS